MGRDDSKSITVSTSSRLCSLSKEFCFEALCIDNQDVHLRFRVLLKQALIAMRACYSWHHLMVTANSHCLCYCHEMWLWSFERIVNALIFTYEALILIFSIMIVYIASRWIHAQNQWHCSALHCQPVSIINDSLSCWVILIVTTSE